MFNTTIGSMTLYQQNDVLLLKVFSASLDEESIAWLQQLPPGSVISFPDLLSWFVQAYTLQIQDPKRTDSLFEIVMHS